MARLTKSAVGRLKALDRTPSGRIKNYYDPETKYVWSARQYRQARAGGIKGETITAVNKAAKKRGKTPKEFSPAKILKRSKDRGEDFERLLDSYQDRERIETGKKRNRTEVLNDPAFWEALENLNNQRSRSPKGKRAKAMEDFGIRPRDAPWRVGESPKRQTPRRGAAKTSRH